MGVVQGEQRNMLVSVGIVAKDAAGVLPQLFSSMLRQTYPLSGIQLVLVDSSSSDDTLEIMQRFCGDYGDTFYQVIVADNPKVLLASGCNVFLEHAVGDILIRLDAHARIPDNFIELNVGNISNGEDIVCGKVQSVPSDDSRKSRIANLAENSMFGGSIAAFRHADTSRYVATGAFAAYRKEVYEAAGFYDERLARTEDNEMHYRMGLSGYRFYYDPRIVSTRKTRPSFGSLLKQKYLNGFWVGVTLHVEPKCFSFYHFVPAVFVLALITTLVVLLMGSPLPFLVLSLLYFFADSVMAVAAGLSEGASVLECLILLGCFPVLHVGYGVGTIVGFLKGAAVLRKGEPNV